MRSKNSGVSENSLTLSFRAQPVYVANSGLVREYEILKASGIYNLFTEPDGGRQLTLHPIQQRYGCANPLILTFLTLGIVPGFLPTAATFEYNLQADAISERRVHNLPLYERISIWEWLVPRNEQKVLADALAWSVPHDSVEPPAFP